VPHASVVAAAAPVSVAAAASTQPPRLGNESGVGGVAPTASTVRYPPHCEAVDGVTAHIPHGVADAAAQLAEELPVPKQSVTSEAIAAAVQFDVPADGFVRAANAAGKACG